MKFFEETKQAATNLRDGTGTMEQLKKAIHRELFGAMEQLLYEEWERALDTSDLEQALCDLRNLDSLEKDENTTDTKRIADYVLSDVLEFNRILSMHYD